jgi:cbb3-type cytochrome oxidase subunit 3
MTWDVIGLILKEHGIYVFAIAVLGWAYWQERNENRQNAKEQAAADKEESKVMITVLVEVRDALRSFKEALETRFPRR